MRPPRRECERSGAKQSFDAHPIVAAAASSCYAMQPAASDKGMDGNAYIRAEDRGIRSFGADPARPARRASTLSYEMVYFCTSFIGLMLGLLPSDAK